MPLRPPPPPAPRPSPHPPFPREVSLNHLGALLTDVAKSGRFEFSEAAAVLTAHTAKDGDRGLVVVGGAMRRRDAVAEARARGAPLDFGAKATQSNATAAAAAAAAADDDDAAASEAEHFSFYALDGRTGELRWKHEGGGFDRERAGEDKPRPQHQYKIDVESLSSAAQADDWTECV